MEIEGRGTGVVFMKRVVRLMMMIRTTIEWRVVLLWAVGESGGEIICPSNTILLIPLDMPPKPI